MHDNMPGKAAYRVSDFGVFEVIIVIMNQPVTGRVEKEKRNIASSVPDNLNIRLC